MKLSVTGSMESLYVKRVEILKLRTDNASSQIDNGLLRLDEAKNVQKTLTDHLEIQLTVVDASQRFLDALLGVSDPEEKRKRIGRIFIEVFQETAEKIEAAAADSPKAESNIEWLLQGTLYPDVVSNIGVAIPLFRLSRKFEDMS